MATIQKVKIHPSIGVARIGNHPTEFFIGPEKPNQYILSDQISGFKSSDTLDNNVLKIKRQGAKFRVLAYFDDGKIEELTSDSAEITWRIKIANTKAKGFGFYGINVTQDPLRNSFVQGNDRESLGIEPKELIVSGINKAEIFEKIKFKVKDLDGAILESNDIILGEGRTDEKGRLIVLAGFGNTGSVKNHPIKQYDDNDYWYDDIADGYIKATVKIKNTGEEIQALDSWVLCVPPKYVPSMRPLITYYDTLFNKYVLQGLLKEVKTPMFFRDIYPIIKRAADIQWVHNMNAHSTVERLLDPTSPKAIREVLFNKLRKPDGTGGNMPRLFGDDYAPNRQGRLRITSVQYNILKKWVNNDFTIDTIQNLEPSNEITPEGLDKAALENCVGGAFYPGIEASWFLRDKYEFVEPFRLDSSKIIPGDITKQMALPWQADFWACSKEDDGLTANPNDKIAWWPFSRPDDVFLEGATEMHEWTPESEFSSYEDMVKKWMLLGFVIEKNGKYFEEQREIP